MWEAREGHKEFVQKNMQQWTQGREKEVFLNKVRYKTGVCYFMEVWGWRRRVTVCCAVVSVGIFLSSLLCQREGGAGAGRLSSAIRESDSTGVAG